MTREEESSQWRSQPKTTAELEMHIGRKIGSAEWLIFLRDPKTGRVTRWVRKSSSSEQWEFNSFE